MRTMTQTISHPTVSASECAQTVQDAGKKGVLAVFTILIAWQTRYVERRQMLEMSDHALHDMGLNRRDVWRAGQKPFWQA